MDSLLEIKNLKTFFHTEKVVVKAVNGVNFSFERGKVAASVGESGCAKSMTALSTLRLIPSPPGEIEGGEIWFHSKRSGSVNLLELSEPQMRSVRGNQIAMIFQEPM